MQAAPASRRSSPRRRAGDLELEMAESMPRNTATICLNGTDLYKILHSYLAAMKDLDDWFRAGTKVVDASPFFGLGHDVVRTRTSGISKMVYEYEGNYLTVPLDGHNLYMRGFSNEYGDFGLKFRSDPKVIHDSRCTILDIGVNYHDLLDDSLERALTGVWTMKKAVGRLCKHRGGPAAALAPYVGSMVIHTSEDARSRPVHSFICRSIVDPNLSRLNKAAGLVIWIRKYSSLSSELMSNIDRMYNGEAPKPIKHFGLNITLQELCAGLQVCYIKSYTKGVFKPESPENKRGPGGRWGHKRGAGIGGGGGGGGQGLMPHKIPEGWLSTASPECSYSAKSSPATDKGYLTPTASPHTVQSAMSQLVQRTTVQIVESPSTIKFNPFIEKGCFSVMSSSYSIRCSLSQMVQRTAIHRAKPSYSLNCNLTLMERIPGQNGCIRRSSEVDHSMFGITSTTHVFTTKSKLKTREDVSKERTNLRPVRIKQKPTKLGSTAIHQIDWANNTRPVSRVLFPIKLLSSNLSSSFPQQNARQYFCRASRLTAIQQNDWANNRRSVSRMWLSINLLSSNPASSFPHRKVWRYLHGASRLLR